MQDGTKRKKIALSKMIRAKCKECMTDYVDGRLDCEIEDYPFVSECHKVDTDKRQNYVTLIDDCTK